MIAPDQVVAYIERRLPDARNIVVSGIARIPGGASRETWSCDAEWEEDGRTVRRGLIIRRDPAASLLETDRQVEFRIYEAMARSGVPVPTVYWMEPEGGPLERPFFIMGRVPGQAAAQYLMSPAYPGSREEIARQKASILARVHRVDWRAQGIDFLGEPPTPETAAAQEIDRWESIMRADALEPQPVLELALRWLKRHRPLAPAVTIVHGDYRTGNFLYDDTRITAVLDWEMVHLGDPMEDIAWLCVRSWRQGSDLAGGLAPRETFYRLYEEAGGYPVDCESVSYWEVLGNLKLAVIFLTGGHTFVDERSNDLILALTTRMIPGIEREILMLLEGLGAA